MKVSVVVPVYNEEKFLRACLKKLVSQSEPPDEIIVVDNNSTDRSVKIASKFPVRIIQEKHQGITWARNKGFNAAKYSIIARTDADTLVSKDWIKKIKKNFEKKHISALSGPSHFYGLHQVFQVSNWPTGIFFLSFRQVCGHDCLYGPNMAIRKSAWEKVKNEVCLNDSKVHEDMDLALHVAKYGQILFDSKLIVSSSFRRWKKVKPYIEYPLRGIRTIQQHHESIFMRDSKRLVKRVVPRTKRLIKELAASTLNSL